MSPSEAIRYHQNTIMVGDDAVARLANGRVNPRKRAVYDLHSKWMAEHFGGTVTPPIQKLPEKIPQLEEKGN